VHGCNVHGCRGWKCKPLERSRRANLTLQRTRKRNRRGLSSATVGIACSFSDLGSLGTALEPTLVVSRAIALCPISLCPIAVPARPAVLFYLFLFRADTCGPCNRLRCEHDTQSTRLAATLQRCKFHLRVGFAVVPFSSAILPA